jgi:arsenite methyltransferase
MKKQDIKTVVKEKYGRIAQQAETDSTSGCCCGPASDCCGVDYTIFSENYESLQGYNKDADHGPWAAEFPPTMPGIQRWAACP